MRFRRTRRGIETSPDEVESAMLGQCVDQLLELLGPEQAPDADPLAALVGLPGSDAGPPDDPALERLLPDAYPGDDPDASREFRRYTEGDLRAGKRADAAVVRATLPSDGGKVVLTRDQADAWLSCLNDLRLVLGTRLQVTQETDVAELAEHDPRLQALQVYGWLGWLQESLLGTLDPRSGPDPRR